MNQPTTKQQEALSKSYDWCANVIARQGRILPLDEMWYAYPFKKSGLSKEGLSVLLNAIKSELQKA
jgi:hypothetical protein